MKLMGKFARRSLALCSGLLALGLVASCGGSTEQIDPFEPTRMFALGDEMSVITPLPLGAGRKYSVNALNADGTALDCVARPIWHQFVAYSFVFTYAECNPDGLADNAAKIFAEPGAKVEDIPAQIERARVANGGTFSNTDLFTVLIGANDVLDLYQNVYLADPTIETLDAIIAELQTRGRRLGQIINELTTLDVSGPKVLVSTMPLMNLTPYALQQAIDHPGIGALNALLQFSQAFNTAMRVTIVNDGRFIGLIELDGLLNAGVNDPGRYGLANITQGVCAVPLPDCEVSATDPTQGTLVTGGNATTWLWASDLWMGSSAHLNLGTFARGRALGNPF